MKNSRNKTECGFTLIELLVVIAIIGILAALILPVTIAMQTKAKEKKARKEIDMIVQALNSYHSAYSRYPVSSNVMATALLAKDDFTYGGSALNAAIGPGVWTTDNSEVIAILMDMENYPNSTPTVNRDHVKNPQRTKFLNAKMAGEPNSPGVNADGVYRDPWGNPYVISIDLNLDERCRDAFYKDHDVSKLNGSSGHDGIFNPQDPSGDSDLFEFNGGVMVWSLGSDKAASLSVPANVAPNRDNIASWK